MVRLRMVSFGWKRKVNGKVVNSTEKHFQQNADTEDLSCDEVEDWISLVPKRKIHTLEDSQAKSSRLKQEGATLAEADRHWEAQRKWDEALQLGPDDASLYEMKAQSFMCLNEPYAAVAAAEKAVQSCPTWWVSYQTLGRARMTIGEVRMALSCFIRAVHLNPSEEDLWKEDLLWAQELLQKKKLLQAKGVTADEHCLGESSGKIIELNGEAAESKECALIPVSTHSGLLDTYLLHMDNKCADKTKEIKLIPKNYVHMRD